MYSLRFVDRETEKIWQDPCFHNNNRELCILLITLGLTLKF